MPPPDWGEIYTTLISHTTLDYFKIGNLPIPGLHAILKNLPEQVKIKRMPYFGGGSCDESEQEEKPKRVQTTTERMAFAARFSAF